MDVAPRFLRLPDVAEMLNISGHQAYQLVRRGELPAIQVGGRGQWRVERSVLEEYIQQRYEEARRQLADEARGDARERAGSTGAVSDATSGSQTSPT